MAPVQPNASVAATGLGIRYVGSWAYGLSGFVDVNNVETSLLDFTSSAGFIVAKIQFNYVENETDAFQFRVYFNEIAVQALRMYGKKDYKDSTEYPLILVIPPTTHVRCTGRNIENSSSREQVVALSGRVYGAEE